MNKTKIIILIVSLLVIAIGVYLFKFKMESYDFFAGLLTGIGGAGLVSIFFSKDKSNFENSNK